MAESIAEIVNNALSEVGHTQYIDDLDDPTEEARVAKAVFSTCLRRCLESADGWQFATKRKALVNDPTSVRTNWLTAFQLPDDFVKLQTIVVDGAEIPAANLESEYTIEANDGGLRVILTNYDPIEIKYTSMNENVKTYSAAFEDALCTILAAKFARALKQDSKLGMGLEQAFYVKIAEASALDKNQRAVNKLQPTTPSLLARGG